MIARTIGMAANRAASNKFRRTYSSTVIGVLRPAARRGELRRRWSIVDPGHIFGMAFTPPRSHARVLRAVKTHPSDDFVPRSAGGSAALPNGAGAAYDALESALGAAVLAAGSGQRRYGRRGGSIGGPGSVSPVREAAPTRGSVEDCVA